MLDELKVRCEAPGCAKVMERGLLLAHLRTCSQAIVTCGDTECGLSVSPTLAGWGSARRRTWFSRKSDAQMARHRLPHHRAYECFHRRMDCDGCGVTVTFREAKDKDTHGCSSQAVHSDKSDGCINCGVECARPIGPTDRSDRQGSRAPLGVHKGLGAMRAKRERLPRHHAP